MIPKERIGWYTFHGMVKELKKINKRNIELGITTQHIITMPIKNNTMNFFHRFKSEYRKHKARGLWFVLRMSWIKYKLLYSQSNK